jgi:chorismate-pyruvate lyase
MRNIDATSAVARAHALISLFHRDPERFAHVVPVDPADLPEAHRTLLDHHDHMTVAMERFHGGPVGLRVIDSRLAPPAADGPPRLWYGREILLTSAGDQVVQYGVVRIDLSALPSAVAERVRRADTPLGRLLMEGGVPCQIEDVRLLAIEPRSGLAGHVGREPTFGRVARITMAGRPRIELLEIIAGRPLRP